MTNSPRRIVFLGTHGQYNIGDELLLETFLAQLGPQHHYVVNTYDPDFTRAQLSDRYDIELIDTRADRRSLLGHLRRCDVLVFGGGSIVKELYASTGRNRYATMLMILATVTFANLVRTPIAMLNVGVGPITTRSGKLLARLILGQVDHLSVRDQGSFDTCRAVGIREKRVRLTPDAVFSMDRTSLLGDAGPAPRQQTTASPLRVALNLNFDIENPDNWELFNDRLAEGLLRFHAERPIELQLLPMQTGFKSNDDATVLEAFSERVPGIQVVRHRPATHHDVARIISDCDLVVSERFHAIVLASLFAVPTLALAYDVKVTQLATMLELRHSTIDINQPFESSEVVDALLQLTDGAAAAGEKIAERAAELHRWASEEFAAATAWIETTSPS